MKIKLHRGKPAIEEDILGLESAVGCKLSDSFKAFVRQYDGARPETNIFRIDDKNDCGVNQFIPVAEINRERSCIENLPSKAYPAAWAEGGNYVFIDEGKDGAVSFWDHELPDEVHIVAASFAEFLDLLQPFNIKSIELKPGQVKRVWVDPEFLKKLKRS